MSWAEFRDLTLGLLTCDSRLWRATRPAAPEPEQTVPDLSGMTY
jgi:hypothetical protein